MAMQILENLQIDNGPIMPQDSIDGIRSTVWHAHEAHIRAIVEHKALKVEHRLSTMGLSDLIDKLERDAPIEEITEVLHEDIMEQIRSKYNNEILVAKSNAYKQAVVEAEQKGHDQASKATESYKACLMDTAKEQARLKADSEFARLLADERSNIAPRVDREIAAEHAKFISD
jgi:flagellar biosynthesis/type III secretory pathway protein FliH